MKESLQRGMNFSTDLNDIIDCNIYIVTVPTPIDNDNDQTSLHLSNHSDQCWESP